MKTFCSRIWSCLLRHKAKVALGLTLCLAGFAWVLWADWPNPRPDPIPHQVDVIVVLGGGAKERPVHAMKLFKEGRAPKVIVTGDGDIIVNELLAQGMPKEALIHEKAATSTVENAKNTLPLLSKMGAKSAVLVTTWTHARRAHRIFEKYIPGIKFYSSFIPSPAELNYYEEISQRRERLAALYCLVVHGVWCF